MVWGTHAPLSIRESANDASEADSSGSGGICMEFTFKTSSHGKGLQQRYEDHAQHDHDDRCQDSDDGW